MAELERAQQERLRLRKATLEEDQQRLQQDQQRFEQELRRCPDDARAKAKVKKKLAKADFALRLAQVALDIAHADVDIAKAEWEQAPADQKGIYLELLNMAKDTLNENKKYSGVMYEDLCRAREKSSALKHVEQCQYLILSPIAEEVCSSGSRSR